MVDWIILDLQPLHTVQSEAFRRFIYVLDPAFSMPCPETVKRIIYKAFNYSFPQLKDMLLTQATSVSLTMDLWTARNRQGYLGVTCSYLDQSFKLREFTLDIAYVRQCCHGTGTRTWDSPGRDSPGHVSYFLCPGHIWDNFINHVKDGVTNR